MIPGIAIGEGGRAPWLRLYLTPVLQPSTNAPPFKILADAAVPNQKLKIGIHSFPAWRSEKKERMHEVCTGCGRLMGKWQLDSKKGLFAIVSLPRNSTNKKDVVS